MRVREYLVLFALAALWGASFLFIRVAVTELSPLTLVGARFVVATLGLLLVVPFQPGIMKGWRRYLWGFFVVAVFNAIVPYLLISWGEQYVASGMSAILAATIPLATVIISQWWPGGERITWGRLIGVALGLLGVVIVIGPTTLFAGGSTLYLLGAGSILLGAVSYAFGGTLCASHVDGSSIDPACSWANGYGSMHPWSHRWHCAYSESTAASSITGCYRFCTRPGAGRDNACLHLFLLAHRSCRANAYRARHLPAALYGSGLRSAPAA